MMSTVAAPDPVELDRLQLVAGLPVVTDHAGSPRRAQSTAKSVIERIRSRTRWLAAANGESPGLLHHHLLRASADPRIAGKPFAGIDLVDLDVAERIARHVLAGALQLRDDGLPVRRLRR